MPKSRKWLLPLALLLVALFAVACSTADPVATGDDSAVAELEAQLAEAQAALENAGSDGASAEEIAALEAALAEAEAAAQAAADAAAAGMDEEMPDHYGAWLDTLVFVTEPSSEAALTRLEVGDLDVYADDVADPELAEQVYASEALGYELAFGLYDELTFNTIPVFADGRMNPFGSQKIREAMNMMVDRTFIAQELFGGMAVPRYTAISGASGDAAAMAAILAEIEVTYAYNPDKATEIITAEMEAMGAELVDGVWSQDGEPINVEFLIRTEDTRLDIGDYVSSQLEDAGFQVTRHYGGSSDLSPFWIGSDPNDGTWNMYTGAWITTAVPRDLGGNFLFFYTNQGYVGVPLWDNYENDPEFYQLAEDLNNNQFETVEQRAEMFAAALRGSMLEAHRIFLDDRSAIFMRRAEVSIAADLFGGISGSGLWAYTLRRNGEVGGSMTLGMPDLLTQPWNPIAGSNWVFDAMLQRGTGELAVSTDPFTGLGLPNRVDHAELTIRTGLPVGTSLDWVTVEFADEIAVPDDAWADWDAETQTFITVGDVESGRTANLKSVVYYPEDLYDRVTWHDGSHFSAADVVMTMITTFDLNKEASPYYDAGGVPSFNGFMSVFKGVKIVSTDPLIIETYSDAYALDAENSVTTWWPYYSQGQAPWHTMAVGLGVEEDGLAAFSAAKAEEGEIEWVNFISGPSIESMAAEMETLAASGEYPYAPTLGEFLGADEAATRYANLQEFYRRRGHFWVGTGPYFLQRAFPVEGTVILERYADYPELATRWDLFSAPQLAEVLVDGSDRVTMGDEATFDVFVDFAGEAYDPAGIDSVSYLLFNALGEVVSQGDAEFVSDGVYTVTLDGDTTGALVEGSNVLRVVVVSNRVARPSSDSLQFVSAP
jgi:peptide/nickel transport system substrate-binding protein